MAPVTRIHKTTVPTLSGTDRSVVLEERFAPAQAERPRTLMVFLDCRHYMPGAEREFAQQDYVVSRPDLYSRVVASMGIEHLGQIKVEENNGQPLHKTNLAELQSLWATNNQKLIDWFTAGELDSVTDFLVLEIDRLTRAGADFGLIAANTPHLVFDQVQARTRIPLLSIVEATADAALVGGVRRPALFGTRFTMTSPMFPQIFARRARRPR